MKHTHEYWHSSALGCWLVANRTTGELVLDARKNIIEYATEEEVLKDFPLSKRSERMGD